MLNFCSILLVGCCPQQYLFAHVLEVNTGKGGKSAIEHFVCTLCVYGNLTVLLPSLYGIYSRSSMFVFIVVSKSA